MVNDCLEPAIQSFSVVRILVHVADELFVHKRAIALLVRGEAMVRWVLMAQNFKRLILQDSSGLEARRLINELR